MHLPPQLRDNYVFADVFKNGDFSVLNVFRDKATGNDIVIKAKQKHHQKQEAEILKQLQHPNILKYLAHAETDTTLYLVTEYIKGEDMQDALTYRVFSEKSSTFIMYSILKGLSYLHNLQIVHRDIRTENIYVTYSPTNAPTLIKIGDFGVAAKLVNGTQYGQFGMTPFIAPEMVHVYNCKVDIYSAGVILAGVTKRCHYNNALMSVHFLNVPKDDILDMNRSSINQYLKKINQLFHHGSSIYN